MKTVLFDLDGTLLPIDLETFANVYIKELMKVCAPKLGCDGKAMAAALWEGTGHMLKNDGSMPNSERFWLHFTKALDVEREFAERITNEFYSNEFSVVKPLLRKTDLPARWIETLQDKGYNLILATNPLFPQAAIKARLDWMGIGMDSFQLATRYDNSSFCKPNLDYYRETLEKTGYKPQDCLMVGNNMHEDMCAEKLGMDTYLITDFLENPKDEDINAHKNGDYASFTAFVDSLPSMV
ncbi:MAG: HAD family hydrolase [Christensenellales bacterium]|jgi:FMN phosphatase YigB (HAD superfamily)